MEPVRYVANISAGLDSPVAVHLMLSRGAEVTLLHFDNRPFGDDQEVEKARTSMLQDYLKGKTLELDDLLGVVVRFGLESGVKTPVSSTVLALVEAKSRLVQHKIK